MIDAKPVSTPLESGAIEALYATDEEGTDKARYAEAIGSLLWLSSMTRPDLAFATSFLARFCAKPSIRHWAAIKRVLRYIRGSRQVGIVYSREGPNLAMFTDSDWAGCRETRASTTGFVAIHQGGPISWRSARQKCVATSSCEAEFIAGSAAAQEVAWLRSIFKNIDEDVVKGPTSLYIDNTGAAELAADVKASKRSKHIDIRYHHLRRCAADGTIRIERVSSASNLADLCTKPLDKVKYIGFRKGLGMRSV